MEITKEQIELAKRISALPETDKMKLLIYLRALQDIPDSEELPAFSQD